MRVIDVLRTPTIDERAELLAFADRVGTERGTPALSDHLRLDLRSGGSDGFVVVAGRDSSGMVGVAQISATNDASSLEVVVRPGLVDARAIHDDLAETAVDELRAAGGGRLYWWVDDPGPADEELAAELGLEPVRAVHELRRQLPLELHATVETRDFYVGADEDAWLTVNNRAFADHGEQGGWTRDTLELRMAEPWFDPAGFRIHEIDGKIAAFCWTKIHHDIDPVLGEIYVIAVDPDHHGQGLGKQLTLAGLDSIAARGITHANLYVDAANSAAVGLYDRLGFDIHRTRHAYAGTI